MTALVSVEAIKDNDTLYQHQALTATAQSTPLDVSDYEGLVTITEVLTSATGAQTHAGTIQTDDDVNFGSPVTVGTAFATYTQSDLKRVARKVVDTNACKRYIRLSIVIAGSTPSIGVTYLLSGHKKVR